MGERLLIFIILVTISWFFCIIKTFRLWLATNMHKLIYMYQMYHDLLSIGLRPASIVRHDMSRILPLKHPWTVSFFPNANVQIRKIACPTTQVQVQEIIRSYISCFTWWLWWRWWWSAIFRHKTWIFGRSTRFKLVIQNLWVRLEKLFFKSQQNLSQFLANRWIIRGW